MKKLMIALAAVAMAAVAQASAVTWGYAGDIYQKNGEDYATGTGWVVFLGTNPDSLGSWSIDATGAISTADSASLITFDSGDNSVVVDDGLWNAGEASTSLCKQNGYYELVVAYKDTNDNNWYYGSVQQHVTALVDDETKDEPINFGSTDFVIDNPVQAAPEPTSGLLLLLGVAGLALKRKRA